MFRFILDKLALLFYYKDKKAISQESQSLCLVTDYCRMDEKLFKNSLHLLLQLK